MTTKELAAKLGLPEDTDEATLMQALAALRGEGAEVRTALGLGSDATAAAVKAKAIAVAAPAATVSLADHAKLAGQVATMQAAEAIAAANAEGKLPTPELREWATKLAARDLDAFNTWCAAAPKVIPTAPVVRRAGAGGGGGGNGHRVLNKYGEHREPTDDECKAAALKLDEQQLSICEQLGISPEQYVKHNPELADQ